MKILEGSPVSSGFAIGIAIVYDYDIERKLTLPDRDIRHRDVQSECDRIDDALEQSKLELQIAKQTAGGDPKLADAAALLSAHASMASEIAASVKQILELADFVAIGTNDLTQYMLAADRDLSEGTDDCTAMHPAVLRAIKQIVQSSKQWNRPVCVCGEEAADADFARLIVGLGIRELSVSPGRAAAIRQAIRGTDSRQATEVAELALQCRSPSEVRALLATGLSDASSLGCSEAVPEFLDERQ